MQQNIPTQSFLTQLYLDSATDADLTTDISQYSDFNNKGQAIGGMGAGLAQDAYNLFNNSYAQYANEQGINIQLANAGVPGMYAASPALLTLSAVGLVSGKTYNIPLGTLLTAPNGATYTVISSTNSNLVNVIVTSSSPTFYVTSVATGQNTTQSNSTVLTISPPIVSTDGSSTLATATVTANTDGADQETLSAATTRLINIQQTPLCGTRASDYYNLAAPNAANSVTDAVVLINNQLTYTDTLQNAGIYLVSGTPINDYILNQGLLTGTTEVVFNRAASTSAITNTQIVMYNQQTIGIHPIVNTVYTQQITSLSGSPHPFFQIVVTLQQAYQLTTQVTLAEGTFTILQLIQREVRRAICQQPYGATLVTDPSSGAFISSSLATSSIEQQLDAALGTPTTAGSIGTYLLDRTVYTWNGTAYVYNPTLPLSLDLPVSNLDGLGWIYDISTTVGQIYANISVMLS